MEKEWTAYPVIHLDLNDIWARAKRFDVPTDTITDPVPVLFQSGYLTIKGYDKQLGMYHLSFPNMEVKQGFSESLCQYYTPSNVGYKKSADAAMTQIIDKDYAKAFADDNRKVVKVGVNFSEDQRSIEDWSIE